MIVNDGGCSSNLCILLFDFRQRSYRTKPYDRKTDPGGIGVDWLENCRCRVEIYNPNLNNIMCFSNVRWTDSMWRKWHENFGPQTFGERSCCIRRSLRWEGIHKRKKGPAGNRTQVGGIRTLSDNQLHYRASKLVLLLRAKNQFIYSSQCFRHTKKFPSDLWILDTSPSWDGLTCTLRDGEQA